MLYFPFFVNCTQFDLRNSPFMLLWSSNWSRDILYLVSLSASCDSRLKSATGISCPYVYLTASLLHHLARSKPRATILIIFIDLALLCILLIIIPSKPLLFQINIQIDFIFLLMQILLQIFKLFVLLYFAHLKTCCWLSKCSLLFSLF